MGRNGQRPTIDVKGLQRLIEEYPDEFRRFQEELEVRELGLADAYGRSLGVKDNVTTPQGETGMVIRVDKKSRRVLVRLDDTGKTRMLAAHRLTVRRGRPRKEAVAKSA